MMSDLLPITVSDMIQEAERELGVRERLYPEWVEKGRISRETASRRIAIQRAIVEALREARTALETGGQHG